MKTPKYVIAPEGCEPWVTAGKKYEVRNWDNDGVATNFEFDDDDGEERWTTLRASHHLNGGNWIIPDDEAEREPDALDVQRVKTLRDEFAMAADISRIEFPTMKSLAEFVGVDVPDGDDFVACLNLAATASAKIRYMFADAMLAARKESE